MLTKGLLAWTPVYIGGRKSETKQTYPNYRVYDADGQRIAVDNNDPLHINLTLVEEHPEMLANPDVFLCHAGLSGKATAKLGLAEEFSKVLSFAGMYLHQLNNKIDGNDPDDDKFR